MYKSIILAKTAESCLSYIYLSVAVSSSKMFKINFAFLLLRCELRIVDAVRMVT